jgi:hypothetical protein
LGGGIWAFPFTVPSAKATILTTIYFFSLSLSLFFPPLPPFRALTAWNAIDFRSAHPKVIDTLLRVVIGVADALLSQPVGANSLADALCHDVLQTLFEIWLKVCCYCFPSCSAWSRLRRHFQRWRHRVATATHWALTVRTLTKAVVLVLAGAHPREATQGGGTQTPTEGGRRGRGVQQPRHFSFSATASVESRPSGSPSSAPPTPSQADEAGGRGGVAEEKDALAATVGRMPPEVLMHAWRGLFQLLGNPLGEEAGKGPSAMPPEPFLVAMQGLASVVAVLVMPVQDAPPADGNTVLSIVGRWLFAAAAPPPCTSGGQDGEAAGDGRNPAAAAAAAASGGRGQEERDAAMLLRRGRAVALATLCQIFCSPQERENCAVAFEPAYLHRFYYLLCEGLNDPVIAREVMPYTSSLLARQQDAVLITILPFVGAIRRLLAAADNDTDDASAELRGHALQMLHSLACLPNHYTEARLATNLVADKDDTEEDIAPLSCDGLPFVSLKTRLVDILLQALPLEKHGPNVERIFAALHLLVLDDEAWRISVTSDVDDGRAGASPQAGKAQGTSSPQGTSPRESVSAASSSTVAEQAGVKSGGRKRLPQPGRSRAVTGAEEAHAAHSTQQAKRFSSQKTALSMEEGAGGQSRTSTNSGVGGRQHSAAGTPIRTQDSQRAETTEKPPAISQQPRFIGRIIRAVLLGLGSISWPLPVTLAALETLRELAPLCELLAEADVTAPDEVTQGLCRYAGWRCKNAAWPAQV